MKYLLTTLFLVTTFSGCSIYQVDRRSDHIANETIAKRLSASLDEYFAEHGNYPENLSQLQPNYVEQLPTTVAGYEFKYVSRPRNSINEFSIYWYEDNDPAKLINKDINGCNVRRKRYKSGEISEINECWRVGQDNH